MIILARQIADLERALRYAQIGMRRSVMPPAEGDRIIEGATAALETLRKLAKEVRQ